MKICCYLLAVLAIGGVCVDGATARPRDAGHRHAGAGVRATDPAKPHGGKADPRTSSHATERRREPHRDLFGNVRDATGASVAPGAATSVGASPGRDADGIGKAGPNTVPTQGQRTSFTPGPAGPANRGAAAKVLPPATLRPAAAAGGGASLNGTGIARPGSATAAIGGPTKMIAVVNGTGMRAKH